jgi:hypothetical protein
MTDWQRAELLAGLFKVRWVTGHKGHEAKAEAFFVFSF